LFNLLNKIPS